MSNPVKGGLLYSGKVKTLYATDQDDYLIAEFRNDITAFNKKKHEKLADKGIINNAISAFIMQYLQGSSIPTHFVKTLSDTTSLIRHLKMIPLECVVRNQAAGSLVKRLGLESGQVLHPPIYELYYKDDNLNDPMVTEDYALSFAWATEAQLSDMRRLSLAINALLQALFDQANITLVDFKLEFGEQNGKIYLGDEISPDSCRLWDKDSGQIFDKDRFRQELGDVKAGYLEIAKRLNITLPVMS